MYAWQKFRIKCYCLYHLKNQYQLEECNEYQNYLSVRVKILLLIQQFEGIKGRSIV